MPIDFDVEEDALYKLGFEESFAKGFAEGLKIGRRLAKLYRTARFVRMGVPFEEAAEIQGLDLKELQAYLSQTGHF